VLFNSPVFLFAFLPLALASYYLARRLGGLGSSVIVLLLASLVFYGYWNPVYLLLLGGSILINFWAARRLAQAEGRARKAWLTGAIAFNLGLLGVFKYAGFVTDTADFFMPLDLPAVEIVLPLAISFFTFQQIAYQVDVFRGLVTPAGFSRYALFVSFFPQLIAGPIVHHKEMMPQFGRAAERGETLVNFQVGLFILLAGLAKKVVLADGAAQYATPIFQAAETGQPVEFFTAWLGSLCYTAQIYFDFSGYSDMAIGAARMFGIKLPTNFFSPYKATSIIDFWRRWHITLSRFLRDYLYIPLGGNRKGPARRYANLLITMVLGGLWHGAGWTFVFWGTLHGLYLIINHAWNWLTGRFAILAVGAGSLPRRVVSWAITFTAVVYAWTFFRAESFAGALNMAKGMSGLNGAVIHPTLIREAGLDRNAMPFGLDVGGAGLRSEEFLSALIYVALTLSIALFAPNVLEITRKYAPTVDYDSHQRGAAGAAFKPNLLWGAIAGLIAALALMRVFSAAPSEFLYFQF